VSISRAVVVGLVGEVTAAAARPPEGPAGRRVESSIERVVGLHTGLDFYILPDL
jgi:hypothetical protein